MPGQAPEAAACALGALADAEGDTELEAQLHATVALVSWHDFNLGHHHAQLALSLLGTLDPDPEGLLRALMAYAQAEFYAGHELPAAAIERGLALERLAPAPSVADRLSAASAPGSSTKATSKGRAIGWTPLTRQQWQKVTTHRCPTP